MNTLENRIIQAQAGDLKASDLLVEENSGLIWSISRRFIGRGVELEDLYQLGCLGFIKAVAGFDFSYGTQFSTYAVPKIAGEIRRFLRDDGAVKVSRGIKERAASIKTARAQLINELGREPTISEISSRTGLQPEEIAIAESATAATESIQEENGEDGFSLEHILSDSESEDSILEKIALKQAIAALPEREKEVINLRYFHGLTQQRCAVVLGISQVQISRVEKRAIAALKQKLL